MAIGPRATREHDNAFAPTRCASAARAIKLLTPRGWPGIAEPQGQITAGVARAPTVMRNLATRDERPAIEGTIRKRYCSVPRTCSGGL